MNKRAIHRAIHSAILGGWLAVPHLPALADQHFIMQPKHRGSTAQPTSVTPQDAIETREALGTQPEHEALGTQPEHAGEEAGVGGPSLSSEAVRFSQAPRLPSFSELGTTVPALSGDTVPRTDVRDLAFTQNALNVQGFVAQTELLWKPRRDHWRQADRPDPTQPLVIENSSFVELQASSREANRQPEAEFGQGVPAEPSPPLADSEQFSSADLRENFDTSRGLELLDARLFETSDLDVPRAESVPQPADKAPAGNGRTNARLVSILSSGQHTESPTALASAVAPVEAPPGWRAIGTELQQRLADCEALINRKAFYSARHDAEEAMLYLVRVLDLMHNQYHSEPAWNRARMALAEAEDFSSAQRLTSDGDFLRRLILSHETPVLKQVDVSRLAPLAAAQHYRLYAEQQLSEAAQGHPWAGEVLYALGRTYQAEADLNQNSNVQTLRWRAVTLYRAAQAITPQHAIASNQLGFVLLQMDRPADARAALVASLSIQPSKAALENLMEASRRLGDAATGDWAMTQYAAMHLPNALPANVPPVVEVDPRTFAALSPYSVGPSPQSIAPASQPMRAASLPNATASANY